MRLALAAALLVAAGAARAAAPLGCPDATEQEVATLVNQARASGATCGSTRFAPVPPLAVDVRLTEAAQLHAQDLAERGVLSHTGADGSSPATRIARAGYAWSTWGENVAGWYPTARDVVAAWLASPGHCANLMSPGYQHLGVGHEYDPSAPHGHYWVQDFARPAAGETLLSPASVCGAPLAGGCGIGPELALALPALAALRRRRS
jgi:uncharacterized protein YkwD